MRQIWISKPGPPSVLQQQEARDPLPRTGEVRIRVEASGVSFADLMARMGLARNTPATPYVPGHEVAGTVDAVGQGVPNLKEGDAVFALTHRGGYSEVVSVPYKLVFKRLDWMSPQDAAALPVSYLMAYMMLIVMGSLRPGDKVLIHNAGGSVGLAALDICHIIGAETYGTASPYKHDFLHQRGLQHPIDYRNQDYERVINDLTAHKGIQIVLDPLGGVHWPKNYRLLMPTGRLIHYGMSSMVQGKKRSWLRQIRAHIMVPFHTPLTLMRDGKAIVGANLDQLWTQPDLARTWMQQIVAWYDEALFRPYVDRTFPFSQAADAHNYLHDRRNIGKVLLVP